MLRKLILLGTLMGSLAAMVVSWASAADQSEISKADQGNVSRRSGKILAVTAGREAVSGPWGESGALKAASKAANDQKGEGAAKGQVRPANVRPSEILDGLVKKYARQYQLEEKLVWAVMRQESGFNPWAVSPKGALGLMQLMPDTAVLMGVTDPFDVEQNIAGGVRFLSNCLKKFDANIVLALAAYNAGPENVVKYKGCPPFPETEDYVAKVIKGYNGKIWVKGLDKQVWVEIEEGEAGKPGDDGLDWKIDRARFLISSPQWKIPLPNAKLLAAGKKIKAGVCARPPLAVGNIKPQVKKSKQAAGEGNLL